MKKTLFLPAVVFTAFTVPCFAGVSLSLENTFPASGRAMGLEVVENQSGSEVWILGANNSDDAFYWYTPEGAVADTTMLDPLNGSCFGVVYNEQDNVFFTNDWSEPDLFFSEDSGEVWGRTDDPSGNSGRGLAFGGGLYWTTNGYAGLLQFTPGYPPSLSLPLPEIYEQLSGLTLFPCSRGTGIAVTTYADLSIWFYSWDGTELVFLGSAPCPAPCQASYGLAYSCSRDTIFWSYKTASGGYFISELEFDTGQSFHQSTWGGIKNSFSSQPSPRTSRFQSRSRL